RVGKNGKKFRMYKFRTMIVDADKLLETLKHKNEMEGAMFKIKNDPRITRIGRFLRKTSMDELPQLWNVLKGEMSLVGPRPPLVEEVKLYTEKEWRRLLATPGCSGLWQISGRNELSFKQMVKIDLYYIDNKTFMLDFIIILKTIKQIIIPRGSY
uniref:sugar transferase n=1 Tax=Enterococcus faecium TaxID=1352 RepID=UPI0023B308AD